jgi:hypothetical protein
MSDQIPNNSGMRRPREKANDMCCDSFLWTAFIAASRGTGSEGGTRGKGSQVWRCNAQAVPGTRRRAAAYSDGDRAKFNTRAPNWELIFPKKFPPQELAQILIQRIDPSPCSVNDIEL